MEITPITPASVVEERHAQQKHIVCEALRKEFQVMNKAWNYNQDLRIGNRFDLIKDEILAQGYVLTPVLPSSFGGTVEEYIVTTGAATKK